MKTSISKPRGTVYETYGITIKFTNKKDFVFGKLIPKVVYVFLKLNNTMAHLMEILKN